MDQSKQSSLKASRETNGSFGGADSQVNPLYHKTFNSTMLWSNLDNGKIFRLDERSG